MLIQKINRFLEVGCLLLTISAFCLSLICLVQAYQVDSLQKEIAQMQISYAAKRVNFRQ